MKAGIGIVVFAVVIIGGGYGYWNYSQKQAEAAVDRVVDRDIADVDFSYVLGELDARPNDRVARLRELYQEPIADQLNFRYAALAAKWRVHAPSLARRNPLSARRIDDARLGSEVDERFGPGAFAVMQDEYAKYVAGAPARERARLEQQRLDQEALDRVGRALQEYMRTHNGQLPPIPRGN